MPCPSSPRSTFHAFAPGHGSNYHTFQLTVLALKPNTVCSGGLAVRVLIGRSRECGIDATDTAPEEA
jgi:hypothetical protein